MLGTQWELAIHKKKEVLKVFCTYARTCISARCQQLRLLVLATVCSGFGGDDFPVAPMVCPCHQQQLPGLLLCFCIGPGPYAQRCILTFVVGVEHRQRPVQNQIRHLCKHVAAEKNCIRVGIQRGAN